ncbi:flavin monoamine oxidase family protein [Aquisalimonas sp. 2447]|uniref:flavin monoamine oxidase family protein n=1 Tax=Aquisalimonas sp. 2447 TaxID=2740807 RepID=UPI0014327BA8|nr:flavin monoamine oxidase family protein [Aquisalimonas sp. 2447]QIT54473.1 flavin monoamine oxidase family protein [Aquisalimonas sp. 2447]
MSANDSYESNVSRRQFLTALGAAGGTGVMYKAMASLGLFAPPLGAQTPNWVPPASGHGRGSEVVVLGAGIAGLTAAYELNKAGYSVTLLEGRERSGGRNWTVRGGDRFTETDGTTQTCQFSGNQYMNMGPARIPQHHTTIEYCRELGVPLEPFVNQNADAYYFNDSGALSGQPVRHRTAKSDLYGYISQMLAKATDQAALDLPLTANEKELLVDFLRNFGDLTEDKLYTGSTRRGYSKEPSAGLQPGEIDLPPFNFGDLLRSEFGLNFSFEFGWNQAMMMFQPVGGMDAIPNALEEAIRPRTRTIYGAKVSGIYNTEDGVQVVYSRSLGRGRGRGQQGQEREIDAKYCICTIPPQILKKIDSNFSNAVKQALEVPTPLSTGKIGLEYNKRFWEEDERILGGITNTNMDVNTIWYPSNDYLSDRGVVIGYYNFGGAHDEYSALSPLERQERALSRGEKIHGPAYRRYLASSVSVAWNKTPFSEGGWVFWPTTGGERVPAYELLNQPAGNVHFAGDHLSYYIAWQAGAFDSARKVVMEVAERDRA